jgi:hypothetical protein
MEKLETRQTREFTEDELEIIELPQREAMLRIHLNNIRLFNNLKLF